MEEYRIYMVQSAEWMKTVTSTTITISIFGHKGQPNKLLYAEDG